ncbi:MAG: trehalase family glycosidase [Pseudomonadota bacterium]
MSDRIIEKAAEILRKNDLGTYTVPTHGLYPFQWNWDSCLTALGQAYSDEKRAWTEIETLSDHQWEDGMVPHIIFHKEDDGYFPGPEVWGTNRPTPTSGITQPPVAGFAVQRLFERAKDRSAAEVKVRQLLPKIHKWHKWFYETRDPNATGLAAIIHPWETGRDNSIDWDAPFDRVPTDGVVPFQRRDVQHANPEHRPTEAQYQRYIWLVQHFRSLGWDNTKLHDASPFQVVDPGFNAILLRSIQALKALAEIFGEAEIANESQEMLEFGLSALETLWSDKFGQYLCHDRKRNAPIERPSIGGLIPLFAPIPKARVDALSRTILSLAERTDFLVASHDPKDAAFDAKRYWRGPVWLIVNYMISDGLLNAGQTELAARIEADSLRLIEESGFAEYYDPITGEACGGGQFTWTAAMVIEFLSKAKAVA